MINYRNTHIIPFEFEYYEPQSISEALEILDKYRGSARILAGGTDLLVKMKTRQLEPKVVVNLKKINGLRYIRDEGDYIKIGALTTLRDIERSDIIKQYIPALHDAVKMMASIQIRNMATIGGNLCNASPAADTAPPLLAYDAYVKAISLNGERIIPLSKLFKGPGETILEPNEILVEINVKKHKGSSAFMKISRTAMDIAIANVAVYLELDNDVVTDIRIAAGSVAPTPVRCFKAEGYLKGLKINGITPESFKYMDLDIKPITDVRSTAEYRRFIVKVLAYDALLKALERLKGGVNG